MNNAEADIPAEPDSFCLPRRCPPIKSGRFVIVVAHFQLSEPANQAPVNAKRNDFKLGLKAANN